MIRNLKITNFAKILRGRFQYESIANKKFSDNVKEVFGLNKPMLVKSNPKNQMFYGKFLIMIKKLFKNKFLGSPMNKAIPKTKQDFVEKLKYLNNTNDMIDIFIQCRDVYGGEEIAKFIEKFNG
jgi:hypothetical protein